MPPKFQNRPSRRRERGLRAQAIVLGRSATPILHEGRTTHLVRVKSTDVPRRYAVGQRLAVKEMVPGPTACNVILFDVKGPSPSRPEESFYLGHVTRQIAKELGHHRLDAFWRHWLLNNDQEWMGRAVEAGEDTDDEIARRFKAHWSEKLAWLLRFTIDTATAPRLLAESGGSDAFRPGSDGRWIYAPRDTDREDDRGYTSSDSRSLKGELPALADDEWAAHVGPKSPYRIADRVQAKTAETWQARYATAKADARESRRDIRSECRRFDLLMAQGKTEKAMRQLELIEARCYPIAA